ncbi:unnamed protein product [Durusdinium trenchii]|uniref:Uncharacterized protein n=1 Tax=Durusdinium trenchii TaxID=1381693 RepID=A0ABP0QBE6_9DINO
MGAEASCVTECGGSDCRPLVQRLIREPEGKESVSTQRYAHAEATATPESTTEVTWGSQMPPLPPVQPGLILHDGVQDDFDRWPLPELDGVGRQALVDFTQDLVRGRTFPVLALNGDAVECLVSLDKQLRYMVIQRTGKKDHKRRALALETVDQVCVGKEALDESGLPLTEFCVCLLLTKGQERDMFAQAVSHFVDERREAGRSDDLALQKAEEQLRRTQNRLSV